MITASLRKPEQQNQPPTVDVEATPVTDDFDAQAGVVSDVPATAETQLPATVSRSGAPVVERYAAITDGAVRGEWGESDIRHPNLVLVNGSGNMSKTWKQGSLVLSDELVLPDPDLRAPNPEHIFRFVPLQITKGYRESLTDEQSKAGIMPRSFKSIEEVEEAGLTTQWINGQKPSAGASARCLLLLEKPAIVEHPSFCLELAGKYYAPAVYYSSGMSYSRFALLLFNQLLSTLLIPDTNPDGTIKKNAKGFPAQKPYLPKRFWRWRTIKVTGKDGKFASYVPEIKIDKEDTPGEIRDWISNLLASESSADSGGE